ncbi:MAG: class I SAM-dependent methyltransferase [Solirubrobacteraceae bacterium]
MLARVKTAAARTRDSATNPAVLMAFRWLLVARNLSAARERPREALAYLLHSREVTNLTYELENIAELTGAVSEGLGVGEESVRGWVAELEGDVGLRADLESKLRARSNRDNEPRFGKRFATYAAIRASCPRVVIETGTHDGLGTRVIARALERNAAEGSSGQVHTFDINPGSGWLIDPAPGLISRHVGDVRELLPAVAAADGVNFFIQDSLKTYEHERWEFETARRHANGDLILYTDDASATDALPELSQRWGARYRSFHERPAGHFWPGNEVGIAVLGADKPALPQVPLRSGNQISSPHED